MPAEVVGGPLDGRWARAPRPGEQFGWIGARGDGLVVSDVPRADRALYEADSVTAWLYAADRWRRCCCGTWVRHVEAGRERIPCPICGAAA